MGNYREKIMIADKDASILSSIFDNKQYSVIKVADAKEAIARAYTEIPDLIIGDLELPQMSRSKFCATVRRNVLLRNTPIVVVTKEGEQIDKLTMAEGVIDDYINSPFNLEELFFRIKRILSRTEAALNANPLTKLPGNILIKQEIELRIKMRQIFSAYLIDLDNFKAFNDRYGFDRGDMAIKLVGDIIIKSVGERGILEGDFIGHIGGDDFVIVTSPERTSDICQAIINRFSSTIIDLYDEKDRKKGSIISEDRKGKIRSFPIMTVSIAVVNYTSRKIIHPAEICERGSELKKYVKSFSGSNYVEDRRKL